MAEITVKIDPILRKNKALDKLLSNIETLEKEIAELNEQRLEKERTGQKTAKIEQSIESREKKKGEAWRKLPKAIENAEMELLNENVLKLIVIEKSNGQPLPPAQALIGDERILQLCRELEKIRDVRNSLTGEEKKRADEIRDFVEINFTGFLSGIDVPPEKRYKVWLHKTSGTLIVLEDSPTYDLSFEKLVEAIGVERSLAFAEVDKTKLKAAIAGGNLVFKRGYVDQFNQNLGGQLATMDWFRATCVTTQGTPKVKVKSVKGEGEDVVISVIKPEIYAKELLEVEKIEGLSEATVHCLKEAGINTFGQLKKMSGIQILSIPGIGEKRCQEIMAAIWVEVKKEK